MNSIYSQVVNPNQEFSIVGGLRSHGERIRILILGAFGFIGTNILKFIDDYLSGQYEVVVFDRTNKHPKGVKINSISKVYTGDITSTLDIENIFRNEAEFDVVLHLVTTTVPAASNDYRYDIETNLISTIQLLEMCKKYKAHKIIYLSSGGTVYGFQTHMPIDEETLAIPINHYGNLKLCIENTFRTFNKQFNTNVIIARIANPYGPGQDYSKGVGFIDAALKRAIHNQTIEIWGDGTVIRDYIYIDDVCHMLASLIYYEGKESVFNISSNSGVSQNEIIKIIHKMVPDISVKYLPARSVDVPAIILNNTKILSVCKEQCIEIEEGITKYYKYLQNLI